MPKDFLLREIMVGDKVVYPTRSGSTMYMIYAEVVEVLPDKIKVSHIKTRKRWNFRDPGEISTLTRLDNVTIVDMPGMDNGL